MNPGCEHWERTLGAPSLSRGYIDGNGRPPRALAVLADHENPYPEGISTGVCLPQRGGRRPRALGARRPSQVYPAGGKLMNEFGSGPQPALTVVGRQANPYPEGISAGVRRPHRGARRPRPGDAGLCHGGRGTRARRWGGQRPSIYPLDNEILAAKASLLSLLSLSLFPTGQIILSNSKNVYNHFKDSDRKSTRLNSSHITRSRMPSSA